MKRCIVCLEEKPLSDFYKNKARRDGYQNYCKSCNTLRARNHYEANKQPYLERARKQKHSGSEWYSKLKEGLSCVDCGENHPATLDFHHVDPSTKTGSVSRLGLGQSSKKRTLAEIEKCIPICSNCHRKRHYAERMKKKMEATVGIEPT